jgi:hypothetical protein
MAPGCRGRAPKRRCAIVGPMTLSRRLPTPTFERIERAWRGQPIEAPDEPEGPPPPPPLSATARRLNWALATAAIGLCLFAIAGFVLTIRPEARIAALGAATLVLALVGLKGRRVLGLAFRGRFIARREREPVLYWASLVLLGLWGAFLVCVAAWSLTVPR